MVLLLIAWQRDCVKATRRHARTPRRFSKLNQARSHTFRTKGFWSAMRLRITFLLLILLTQTEIVAEHGLERFAFPILKITDARWANRSESRPEFF